MQGNVIGFDPATNTGAISGHDGNRYDFVTADWRARSRPQQGDVVDFQALGPHAKEIYRVLAEYVQPGFFPFYFSPSGRISRSQYWLRFFLPVIGISILFQIAVTVAAVTGSATVAGILYVLYVIFALVTLWPGIAVLVKRIHDRNKTGWLVLLPYVPLLLLAVFGAFGAVAGGGAGFFGGLTIFSAVAFLAIAVWFFIEFGCLRGTIGDNRFGADPVREA